MVRNSRLVPAVGSKPKLNTAGNTAMPAKMDTSRSQTTRGRQGRHMRIRPEIAPVCDHAPQSRWTFEESQPIAMSTTEPSIREKSGMNRNFRPSIALGKVRLRMQTTTSRMNKSGIRMRVAFSMPPDAPRRMTEARQPRAPAIARTATSTGRRAGMKKLPWPRRDPACARFR